MNANTNETTEMTLTTLRVLSFTMVCYQCRARCYHSGTALYTKGDGVKGSVVCSQSLLADLVDAGLLKEKPATATKAAGYGITEEGREVLLAVSKPDIEPEAVEIAGSLPSVGEA